MLAQDLSLDTSNAEKDPPSFPDIDGRWRIFNTPGSDVVLEVLGKKVKNVDDEIALLHELKDIKI